MPDRRTTIRASCCYNHCVRVRIAVSILACGAAACGLSDERQDLLACISPDGSKTALFYREAKLADSSRLKVRLLQKPSNWDSFVNDKTRCEGGTLGAIDSEPRLVEYVDAFDVVPSLR